MPTTFTMRGYVEQRLPTMRGDDPNGARVLWVPYACLVASAVWGSLGCSPLFVTPPPSQPAAHGSTAQAGVRKSCTTSKVAPVLDLVAAVVVTGNAVRVLKEAAAPEATQASNGEILLQDVQIGLGIALAGSLVSSAVWGFKQVSRCDELQEPRAEDETLDPAAALNAHVALTPEVTFPSDSPNYELWPVPIKGGESIGQERTLWTRGTEGEPFPDELTLNNHPASWSRGLASWALGDVPASTWPLVLTYPD